jgi:acetolactate synthase-1/2/3 large subunit
MLLAEYAGRRPNGFNNIVELAETTGSAVWDVNNALNFPNKHPLCLSMDKASLRHTDLVLGLDLKDWEKQLTELNSMTRQLEPLVAPNCDYVEIGFAEVGISKWAMDYCRMQPCSVRALGDTETARSRSASATTRSGPSGNRTPRRTGTLHRSPSSASLRKCGR